MQTAPGMDGIYTLRQRVDVLRTQLKTDRSSFESHWQDLADHIAPRRYRRTTSKTNQGTKANQKIIDTTPVFAARTLSSGMMSGITSPARPWFRLTLPDKSQAELGAVKLWLDQVREIMSAAFMKSNLYNTLPTLYADMGVFGTGAMAVLEDPDTVIRCVAYPVGEYWIANNDRLQVRTFVREYRQTVRQLVQRFGQGMMQDGVPSSSIFSEAVRTAWQNKQYETPIDVVHVIEENAQYDPTKLSAKFKRFRSCYYELASQTNRVLEESGYDEFPVLVGRWDVAAGDVYGTSCPGMDALGDIKMLQHGEKRSAQAFDKFVSPPMTAPVAAKASKLSVLPADVSYVDEGPNSQGFKPAYQIQYRPDLIEARQNAIRQRIDRAFFVDLFLMLAAMADRKQITATEIIERKEEKLLALGPVLEQLNQDILDPLIERTFNILVRQGRLPEPPEELQGSELKVEYVSVMAQAQKALGRSGMDAFALFAGELVKLDPGILDKIDRDEMVEEYAEMCGIPPQVVVPDEQVQQVRAARAKAQQQAQAANAAAQMTVAAKNLASADTSGKNALTDLQAAGVVPGLQGVLPGGA